MIAQAERPLLLAGGGVIRAAGRRRAARRRREAADSGRHHAARQGPDLRGPSALARHARPLRLGQRRGSLARSRPHHRGGRPLLRQPHRQLAQGLDLRRQPDQDRPGRRRRHRDRPQLPGRARPGQRRAAVPRGSGRRAAATQSQASGLDQDVARLSRGLAQGDRAAAARQDRAGASGAAGLRGRRGDRRERRRLYRYRRRHPVRRGLHDASGGPGAWQISPGMAEMGWAASGVLGGVAADPSRPAIVLTGDGAFNLVNQAVCHRGRVQSAGHLGDPEQLRVRHRAQRHGALLPARRIRGASFIRKDTGERYNPDYVALAHAYGAEGARIEDPELLGPTLRKASPAAGPGSSTCRSISPSARTSPRASTAPIRASGRKPIRPMAACATSTRDDESKIFGSRPRKRGARPLAPLACGETSTAKRAGERRVWLVEPHGELGFRLPCCLSPSGARTPLTAAALRTTILSVRLNA